MGPQSSLTVTPVSLLEPQVGWELWCLRVLDLRPVKEEGDTARAPQPDRHDAVEEPLQQGIDTLDCQC